MKSQVLVLCICCVVVHHLSVCRIRDAAAQDDADAKLQNYFVKIKCVCSLFGS